MTLCPNKSSKRPAMIALGSLSHHRTTRTQTQTLLLFSNIQSKIIIDSQTSTVKIQHHFRYRGPLLKNGISPSRMYIFFFSPVQLCSKHHYLYKPNVGCQTWISQYLQNSLPHVDYRLMQPVAEQHANLPFKFVFCFFAILPFQPSLRCKAIPAVPSRLRQTQRNMNANTV